MHTTASDGRSSPDELVREAAAAGLRIIAVTDHDTTAGVAAVVAAGLEHGIECLPGIEITAVRTRRDVHLLAYFFDPNGVELSGFLRRQREDRRRRLFEMVELLERYGTPVDVEAIRVRASLETGRALGRPLLADALVRAGHARTIAEAFERYLGEGRPAYVERDGASPREVIGLVARAGGLTSIAHPGKLHHDEIIPEMIDDGLAAIEVFHPDHDDADVSRYREMASMHGVLVTGGSDYHGPGSGRTGGLGRVTLPAEEYARLTARAGGMAGRA